MPLLPALGPHPLSDLFGMRTAIHIVTRSTPPGRNSAALQFDTLRKYRTTYLKAYHIDPQQLKLAVMSKELKKVMATTCPTEGEWFTRFISGMEARLGRQLVQDLGISIDVMLKIQELLEEE